MTPLTHTVTVTPAQSGGWLWSVTAPDGAIIAEAPRPSLTRQGALCSATRAHRRWLKGEPPPKRDQHRYAPRKLPRGGKTVWFYDDEKALWWRDFGAGLRGEMWVSLAWNEEINWRIVYVPEQRVVARNTVTTDSHTNARAACCRAFRRYEARQAP